MKLLIATLVFLTVLSLVPGQARAQWSANPYINTPICTAPGDQEALDIVSDGRGGLILAWVDRRSGSPAVYAQRMNKDGVPLWASNGVLVKEGEKFGFAFNGDGGAGFAWVEIAHWEDTLGNERCDTLFVHAGTVDSLGLFTLTVDRRFVDISLGISAEAKSDGCGGVIVCWVSETTSRAESELARFDSLGNEAYRHYLGDNNTAGHFPFGAKPLANGILVEIHGGGPASGARVLYSGEFDWSYSFYSLDSYGDGLQGSTEDLGALALESEMVEIDSGWYDYYAQRVNGGCYKVS